MDIYTRIFSLYIFNKMYGCSITLGNFLLPQNGFEVWAFDEREGNDWTGSVACPRIRLRRKRWIWKVLEVSEVANTTTIKGNLAIRGGSGMYIVTHLNLWSWSLLLSFQMIKDHLLDREDVLADDARRWRCIRVGSTSGRFARRANNERTVERKRKKLSRWILIKSRMLLTIYNWNNPSEK